MSTFNMYIHYTYMGHNTTIKHLINIILEKCEKMRFYAKGILYLIDCTNKVKQCLIRYLLKYFKFLLLTQYFLIN